MGNLPVTCRSVHFVSRWKQVSYWTLCKSFDLFLVTDLSLKSCYRVEYDDITSFAHGLEKWENFFQSSVIRYNLLHFGYVLKYVHRRNFYVKVKTKLAGTSIVTWLKCTWCKRRNAISVHKY